MNDDVPNQFERVKTYAKRLRKEKLNFNSEHLQPAPSVYVGWIDLMGAGHIMGTSVQKSANFLARLHIAVDRARSETHFQGRLLAINDGIFIISESKSQFGSLLGRAMIMLSCNFVAVPRPNDRFLLRGGIAYGPIYFGENLTAGLRPRKYREAASFLNPLLFGPALIQAFNIEKVASPYGIAVHDSARAFHPAGEEPFRSTHWMWWAPDLTFDYPIRKPPLNELKDCLNQDLQRHFEWMKSSLIYHSIDEQKVSDLQRLCAQYFALG